MQRGHLEALVVNIPFYTDNSSDGRPSLAHYEISTSDVNSSSSLKFSDLGISYSTSFYDHKS